MAAAAVASSTEDGATPGAEGTFLLAEGRATSVSMTDAGEENSSMVVGGGLAGVACALHGSVGGGSSAAVGMGGICNGRGAGGRGSNSSAVVVSTAPAAAAGATPAAACLGTVGWGTAGGGDGGVGGIAVADDNTVGSAS